MRERVTFTYKNGFAKTKFQNISDKHLDSLRHAVNNEILRREEAKKYPEPPRPKRVFIKKLRRFIRRLNAEIIYHAETTALNHIVGSEQACNSPYIGLIDETVS